MSDSRLTAGRTIAARKTELVLLEEDVALKFIEDYHRSGKAKPGKNVRSLGLTYEGELLAVAIFCNPRTSGKQKEYTTELFRMAFKNDVRIQGGASKLIKTFMTSGVADLFTYQDTSGEATSVYELSGMVLKGKKSPTKQILVRDGITASEAENNRIDWFSMEQVVRRGPDALIGTSLGEVIEDGKRVSNVELFKRSGYHLETIAGDRVYEWRNPEVRFYTYKITSTLDDGYYYGRHRIFSTELSEMLNDGYMGSGGKKYKNWVASVGKKNLRKEVLGIYNSWKEVIPAEVELIGSKSKDDPRCKNSMTGGTGLTSYLPEYTIGFCPIHGEAKFRGGCKKCSVMKAQSMKDCPTHGSVIHVGDSCYKCRDNPWSEKECPIHGVSLHNRENCQKCVYSASSTLKECPKHGLCLHNGDGCCTCTVEKSISIKECPTHGETKYVGDHCKKCLSQKTITTKECSTHGLTDFKGNLCCKCSAAKGWTVKECSIHGESKHRGGTCEACTQKERALLQKSQETLETCPVHGQTAHSKGECKRCKAQKQLSTRECPVHGATKFNGDTCGKCAVKSVWTVESCSIHGEVKHRSGKCERCSRLAQWAARKARESQSTDA